MASEKGWKIEPNADKIEYLGGNDFKITASAFLSNKGNPEKDKDVSLWVGGEMMPDMPKPSDENGKVVDTHTITTTAKTIAIEAQEVGFGVRGRKSVNLPWPEKEKGPKTKMKITISGPSGQQKDFFVSVVTPGPLEQIIFSSNVELTLTEIDPPPGPKHLADRATLFDLQSTKEKNLYVGFSFATGKKDATLVITHPVSGETHKRMLIK